VLINSIRSTQKRLGLTDPIVLVFIPTAVDVIGHLNERGVVYYCIDEMTGYGYVDKIQLLDLEERLLAKSDCVIASAAKLADAKRRVNDNTFYVPHGVDWALFRSALEKELEIPEDIAGIKKPIIGFYGYISEDWIDLDLLKKMAELRPNWSIVLIGKSAMDVNSLTVQRNIHFLGVKLFEDLPKYSRMFDAAIIPFKINELTLNSNPLKLLEYLAAGKPVVSVDIPEVAEYKDMVKVATTPDGFVKAVEQFLKEDSLEDMYKRSDYVRSGSWNSRMETISQLIDKCVLNDN
jgi:glycosyltransferase involved in cell wall biosynthesis